MNGKTNGKPHKLDMTMMYAVHNAFRRDLEHLARTTARTDDDPRHILRTTLGWELFKTHLHVHHTSEDDTVWGVMEGLLVDRPDDLALMAAMEAEHAAIDPMITAIDEALADRESGPERLGGLVETLATKLGFHLKHEEDEGLALIDSALSEEQWMRFAEVHRERIGPTLPRYMPWLLDDQDRDMVAAVLSRVPEKARLAYEDEWRAAFAELDLWGSRKTPAGN
ncbi:hemerythrin domain-containing protein [Streptomyces sp. TRM43335]|uniref:Hemerythrin domain-containing protein n=1 Tax=Streptomyces taklimakanensis TaxID=2569853 RepID=A0A6G2BFM4_9ACTN|nr:hemerythrin domain-containing protein [Streptomyces taklimakanensis]MTE21004.1 hemerythrin domain-containing protein [Streptomyces taklimakanensis]